MLMLDSPLDSRSLYTWYDLTMLSLQPYSEACLMLSKRFRRMAENTSMSLNMPFFSEMQQQTSDHFLQATTKYCRELTGYFYFYHMISNIYEKPKFDIKDVQINDEFFDVLEEKVDCKSFGDLLRFKKKGVPNDAFPKMLLVAPMSGHYATLLRDTAQALLPFYDVYITDWKNARDVPLSEGGFDLEDFIDYIISYFRILGPELNVMAVCQPTVPVLAALALMSTAKEPTLPRCAILLGGPVDTSVSPTAVSKLAISRRDDWFQQNVISLVPNRFPGAMRLVYPGFMQLSGFMSMNFQRHLESVLLAIKNYSENNQEAALKTLRFYLEYFSTMDLTAEFYMQTIHTVFQEQLLARGHYKSGGNTIRLRDIKDTSILIIEGQHDDITGLGQTKSAIKLCTSLPDNKKKYFLAKGVGHYGLFNGSNFRNIIIPKINSFILNQSDQGI